MRGRYDPGSRKLLTSTGYKVTIGVIVAIAVALVLLLLVFLPATDQIVDNNKTVVSISSPNNEIGLNVDLSQVNLTVTYSDGTTDIVRLDDMVHGGLDVAVAGVQNVCLNFGGFEQTIVIEVKDVDCKLKYEASLGGHIQGEVTQTVTNGGVGDTIIAIPETGYVFTEWNDGFPYAERKDIDVTENATYLANFKKASYTVIFYYSNGTVASETQVLYGEAPTKIPNPSTEPNMQIYGYTFSNWIPANFSSVDRDMVIRPEYIKTATDVVMEIPTDIYNNQMGSTDLKTCGYYSYNQTATITATPYNSRQFHHWLIKKSDGSYGILEKESTKTFTVGGQAVDIPFKSTALGAEKYILSFTPNEDINKLSIKAVFAYEKSTIQFVNNQSDEGNFNFELNYGDPLSEMVEDTSIFDEDIGPCSVIGMKFIGWFVVGDAIGTKVSANDTFTQPTQLVAKWEKLTYAIRFYFEREGCITIDKTVYVKYQNTFASATSDEGGLHICGIPTEKPELESNVFVGWKNSIINEMVDDKTKVVVNHNNLDNNGDPVGDFANRLIQLTAVFTPIEHRINVNIEGSGLVDIVVNNDLENIQSVVGVYDIKETYKYTLNFKAFEGYAVRRIVSTFENNSTTVEFTQNEDNFTIEINEKGDTEINVIFESKKFEIVVNLEDQNVGSLSTDLNYTNDGTSIIINSVNYNDSINLELGIINSEYVIQKIVIDGSPLIYENGNYQGEGFSTFNINLENIVSDKTINVYYKANKHTVSTPIFDANIPAKNGEIVIADFYNKTQTTQILHSQNDFVNNSYVNYRISSKTSGYAINEIMLNGFSYGQYNSGKDSIIYNNWWINGVDSNIVLIEIDGNYVYNYGEFSKNGHTYMLCQNLLSNAIVYEKLNQDDGFTYTVISDSSVISYGKTNLNYENRNIYNSLIAKDKRITQIDMLLKIDKNYIIDVNFVPMVYTIAVVENAKGITTVSNSNVGYNGTSIVEVAPISGYNVVSYSINGGSNVQIIKTNDNAPFSIKFENTNKITEDKNITFNYEKIVYTVTIKNNNTTNAVYVDGNLLNCSRDYTLDYKANGNYLISLANNSIYRIATIRINGVEQFIHFNMTQYELDIANITNNTLVEITCGDMTESTTTEENKYTISSAYYANAKLSYQYIECGIDEVNLIHISANLGYYLVSSKFTGSIDGITITENYDNTENWVEFAEVTIPANSYKNNEVVSIILEVAQKEFDLTTVVVEEDVAPEDVEDLAFVKRQAYGDTVVIDIKQIDNYYIKTFKIDNEVISFENANWSSLVSNSITKTYTSGVYNLQVSKSHSIYLEYAVNEYKVVLDKNSINGNTTLSAYNPSTGITRTEITSIKHGENLIIALMSNNGYHINGIKVNNVLVEDLVLTSSTPNQNKDASYTLSNVKGDLIIYTMYEINRYSFNYEINNLSPNFATYDVGPGSLSTDSSLTFNSENKSYFGIANGHDFYINILPAILNGYYLVDIEIYYDGYTKVRAGEGQQIASKGGIIYFNTMLNFRAGVTKNIELIRLNFNKNIYNINIAQTSGEETGTLSLSYEHPNDNNNNIILFGDSENEIYYFIPANNDTKIYQKNNGLFEDTGFVYKLGNDGKYHYYNGDDSVNIKIEHGIRYKIITVPSLGYERNSFIINNKEINGMITNNTYSTNIVKNIEAVINFQILIYNVDFQMIVANKNLTGRIDDENVANFASIKLVDFTDINNQKEYLLMPNKSSINVELCYGTIIKFVMTPNFEDTGYYLYDVYYNEYESSDIIGDVNSEAIFGSSGIEVIGDINVLSNFRIKKYNINTNIVYSESIEGESANKLTNEATSSISWGDSAYIKVNKGSGYIMNSILLQRGLGALTAVSLNPTDEQKLNDAEVFFVNKRNPATNEYRDVLEVRNVKDNLQVIAVFERKNYEVRFVFNNKSLVKDLTFSINKPNYVYPYQDNAPGNWINDSYVLSDVKHYDELSGVISPKNGYEFAETYLTFYEMVYDYDQSKFVQVLDSQGNAISYNLAIEMDNDSMGFKFHQDDQLLPDFNVQNILFVELNIQVKTYTVLTQIDRSSSNLTVINDTQVVMSVKTQTGQSVRINNVPQSNQTFTKDNYGKVYIAEHHGKINYSFSVPEGYMLSYLLINGREWTVSDFCNEGFVVYCESSPLDELCSYSVVKNQTGENKFYYSYFLTLNVKDDLVNGANGYIKGVGNDINIIMRVELIQYTVKGIINSEEYPNTIVNSKKTFTDIDTINVYATDKISHYSDLFIIPELFEGYTITSLYLGIMVDGVLTNIGYTFNTTQTNRMTINNINLKFANMLNGNLDIYICYTTQIKEYVVDISPYAYSIEIWGDKTNGDVAHISSAGDVHVSAFKNGVRTEPITEADDFEYFTNITMEATAKENYAITDIEEFVTNKWQAVINGERGISLVSLLLTDGKTQYTLNYMVNSIGNRKFRVILRQEITTKIEVINPYKFQGTTSGQVGVGKMNYIYYPEIIANVGGVIVENEIKTTNKVVEEYEYKIYVGYKLALSFKNSGKVTADNSFGVYSLVDDTYIQNSQITTVEGYEISQEATYYLMDITKLYITYEKQTNSALSTSIGGSVYFGLEENAISITEPALSINYQATVMQKMKMQVVPKEHYIYYGMQVRQIDNVASKLQGIIVYKQGSDEWLTYDPDNFASLDTNGSEIILLEGTVNKTYQITMKCNLEIRLIFYKTYDITYEAVYSDTGNATYTKDNEANVQTDGDVVLENNTINNNLLSGITQISYSSQFTLQAKVPDSRYYQFVGWYVNGDNLYKYLNRKFPDDSRLRNGFDINKNGMTLAIGDMELDTIEIKAVYERIIDVNLINELFYYEYADGKMSHYNSWETGSIRSQYFGYEGSSEALAINPNVNNLNNLSADTIANTLSKEFYTNINNYGNTNYNWNMLKIAKDSYMTDESGLYNQNNSYVYSNSVNYQVLHQNVTNSDYIKNTWTGSNIELLLLGLPNTVRLQTWQYYNWITNSYEEINYQYFDPSGLLDNMGNEIIVNNSSSEYILSMDYVLSDNMPGAIKDSNNALCPLIIRPFMRKVISVNLEKLVYIDSLAGSYEEQFSNKVAPSINSSNVRFITNNNFAGTGDPYQYTENGYGEYDYGARITIRSYSSVNTENNEPVYTDNDGQKYRFLGWQYQWKVNNVVSYRYLLDMDGENNLANENYEIQLYFDFGEVPPSDDMIKYRAMYIYQYEHDIYTYNIAGGTTYNIARQQGMYGYKNAPELNVDTLAINTSSVSFEGFDKNQSGSSRITNVSIPYGYDFIVPTNEDKYSTLFYIDIGCSYSFSLDDTNECNVDDYISSNATTNVIGYDSTYDKQYAILFKENNVLNESLKSYYDSHRFLGAYSGNPHNTEIYVNSDLELDIQYVSNVKLEFTNVMYGAGINLPLEFSRYLSNGLDDSVTVWDTDNYCSGDATIDDGIVRISVPLNISKKIDIDGNEIVINNMWGAFKYAPKGYKDGFGITPLKSLVYYLDSQAQLEDSLRINNDQNLFAPYSSTYRRHIIINYDQQVSPYVDGGTMLFGNPAITGVTKYQTSNTGNGDILTPYKIYNVLQLKNINMFWYYNEYSCNTSVDNKTNFILINDINLQSLLYTNCSNESYMTRINGVVTSPIAKAWIPICYLLNGDTTYGFDGVLQGNHKSIYGIAVYGGTDGNLTPSDPGLLKEHELYDYTHGYGVFGHIGGGEVKDIYIGNAYINLSGLQSANLSSSAIAKYVGVLAATVSDAKISDIDLIENNKIGRLIEGSYITRLQVIGNNASLGVGSLFGRVDNSTISNVKLYINNSTSNIKIKLQGNNVGGIIGCVGDPLVVEDNIGESNITNLQVNNSSTLYNYFNITGKSSAGGIFGFVNENDAKLLSSNFNGNGNGTVRPIISSSFFAGGIVGKILSGTLKDSIFVSGLVEAEGSIKAPVASSEVDIADGSVGGFVGYNNGVVTNRTLDENATVPYTIPYVRNCLRGNLRMMATRVGGIVGDNGPNGEINGISLNYDTTTNNVYLDLPFTLSGSYQNSGVRGGIVAKNEKGGLINDCSVGDSTHSTSEYYMKVYDGNGNSTFDYVNTEASKVWPTSLIKYALILGNLYVGGIVGITSGAVYNSYVQNANIFTKYYNGISNIAYDWNLFIGGIAGAQNVDSISTGTASSNSDKENMYSLESYVGYNWFENNGVLTEKVANNFADRTNIQSCYTEDVKITTMITLWCDNNTGYETTDGTCFIGEYQGVSIGGIVGRNAQKAGTSSVNTCYSYNDTFDSYMSAYGATNYTGTQFDDNVGWFKESNGFLQGNNYSRNHAGSNLAVNIRGIVGGTSTGGDGDTGSASSYCWTGNNKLTGNMEITGSVSSAATIVNDTLLFGENFDSSAYYARTRGIGLYGAYTSTNAKECVQSGGIRLESGAFIAVGSEENNRLYSSDASFPFEHYFNDYKGGCVGYTSTTKRDGRIFATDPDTGLLMAWRPDLTDTINLTNLKWYMDEQSMGMGWYAAYLNNHTSYLDFVNNSAQMNYYLVRGQVNHN
ncbi:MAG: hypothetical protein WCR54_02585 [Clostridia bacterium]